MSRSADIDKMVSGFLSELDALYDSLESGKTRKDTSKPGIPYRNIDILLMNDDRAKTRAGLAATEPVLGRTVPGQSRRRCTFWSRWTSLLRRN
ncbi:MAG: hypothetical protein GXX84_17680 [Acidobacteria bacterium]|nr:hypothetical protein [Acidobacteriota bacterium]